MSQPIRVLIADDNMRARDGLHALLVTLPEVEVVGQASNGREAVRLVGECRPEAVLMDLQMPVLDGLQATRLIKATWPSVSVIILTMHATQQRAALEAGADAFVLKGGDPERLLAALGVLGGLAER